MSEQLEIISLRKENKELRALSKKQSNSIIELCCLLVELNQKLKDNENESTYESLKLAFDSINKLINLKLTRAKNYMYKLTGDDVID